MLRIGLIGLDTSHAQAFTQILCDPSYEFHLPGANVVGAYRGGSDLFSLSMKRIDTITRQLVSDYNLQIYDDIKLLTDQVDAILLLSGDGRQHLAQFRECAVGKPVFIDKPLTCSLAEGKEIFLIAEATQTPVMSASSLRFVNGMEKPVIDDSEIFSCEIFGPMPEYDDYPGLFWYGIHCVDIAYQLNGQGCVSVTCWYDKFGPVLSAEWNSGMNVFIRGFYNQHASQFGWILYGNNKIYYSKLESEPPYHYFLMKSILDFFCTGVSRIDLKETLETIAFIEAAHRSRTSGKRESLEL